MSLASLINRRENVFCNGAWHRSQQTDLLNVINPSTGESFSQINVASAGDVDQAVTAAANIFPHWRTTSGQERAGYLNGFATGLKNRFDDLVELQMLNSGKPKQEAQIDVNDAVSTFEYYAGLAQQLEQRQGEAVELADDNLNGQTRYEPIGPVGMIVPWNFPLVTSAWKIAPALAAGCTVVLKNSEVTPLIELVYADIAQEIDLPAGVLNIFTGAVEAGVALTADDRLRKISFTGSNAVGAQVMAAVSSRCLPLSLELGGKSPIVVLADADLEQAVECIMAGIFFNCGQMCSATSRLIIDEKITPQVIEKLIDRTSSLTVGAPLESEIDMGPMTFRSQFSKVQQYFEKAKSDGLICLTGGNADKSNGGYFVEPTIYMDVPVNNRVWREEIFGPVLAIKTFKNESQAIQLANDSNYALVATLVSRDVEKAEKLAAQIDGGHLWINSPQIIFPNTAWGGFRASGIGRELGPWGLSAYQGVKHLTIAS